MFVFIPSLFVYLAVKDIASDFIMFVYLFETGSHYVALATLELTM